MKEMDFYGCKTLSLNEAVMTIGGDAYDVGHAIGETIRDFGMGLWDGLCGK
jgi:hypothetical protein